MKEDCFSQRYIEDAKSINKSSSEMVRQILEYRAREKDNMLQNHLLKKLILDYSEAERKLVELNKLKNKFLGIAAHDLRNPLTSIRGFCEILLEDTESLTEDTVEMITIIHQALAVCSGL